MLASLLALIFANQVLGAKYNSSATLSMIVNLYNQKKFTEMYNIQGPLGKNSYSRREYTNTLNQTYNKFGSIIAQLNVGLVGNQYGFDVYAGVVCFNKTLGFQILAILVKNKNTSMIVIDRPKFSSIQQYNKSNLNSSSTIYINDIKKWDSNGDVMRPVGTAMSQIIVGLEYANQVIAGKLNITTVINIRELQKYLIPNFDAGEVNISYSKNQNLTLQKVVEIYLGTNSYAAGEYLMDLLGIDNLRKLLVDLDVKQTDVFYPSSFYLALTAVDQKSPNISKYISQLNQSQLEQKVEYIHDQLKQNSTNSGEWLNRFIQRIFENKQICDLIGIYQQQSTTNSYAWLGAQILGFNLSLSSGQDPSKVLAFYYATIFPTKGLVNQKKTSPTGQEKILSDFSVVHASRQGVSFESSKNLYLNLCGQYEFLQSQQNITQAVICLFSTGLNGKNIGDSQTNFLLQDIFFGYSPVFRQELLKRLNITVERLS